MASSPPDLLERFELAWRSGTPPQLEKFIPSPEDPRRHKLLEELIKIDLEYRCRLAGNQRMRLEDYAQRIADLRPVERISTELIGEEYRVRRRWGDCPGHEEYRARFPRQEGKLTELLKAIDGELAVEAAALGKGALPPPRGNHANARLAGPAGADSARAIVSVDALIDSLRHDAFLSASQLNKLTRDIRPRCRDPQALARALLQRGWLTPYQVNQLLQGRGAELVIGPYLILNRLGEGGAGQVFKAQHRKMSRVVALKLIRKELLEDAEVVGRFYREIQVASQLDHANVVHAYDAGPAGPSHFLAMEYVEGTDLAKFVKQGGSLPALQACEYIRQAALGLQHAHEKGLVHRDIKPHNLMMSVRDGLIKVADLGLARLPRGGPDVTAALTGVKGSGTLTPENAVMMGTADYLAPEQALDFHKADIRADIYSLGCTFYYLLTGEPPFPGATLAEKLVKHQQVEPPAVERVRSGLPSGLTVVLRKMLAKRPEGRYQTPGELAAALASIAGPGGQAPAPRRRRLLYGICAGSILGAVLLAVLLKNRNPNDSASNPTRNEMREASSWQHKGKVHTVAFSSDGRWAASNGEDREAHVWDVAKGQKRTILKGISPGLMLFSPDGETLFEAWFSALHFRRWNVATGMVEEAFTDVGDFSRPTRPVGISPDLQRLARTGTDELTLWDVPSRKPVSSLKGKELGNSGLGGGFSPNGQLFFTGSSYPALVALWDVKSGAVRLTLLGQLAVTLSPDGQTLATADANNAVKLWDMEGRDLATLTGHTERVTALAFSGDGKTLASGSRDKTVKLWSVASRREWTTLHGHQASVGAVALDAEGRNLITGSDDGTVKLWGLIRR